MDDRLTRQTPAPAMLRHGATVGLRLRGAVIAAVALSALLTASALHPYPSGMGTHEQLGLPACTIPAKTGWPCPTCGLTTSVAAMADGRLIAALRAQPFGVVMFAALVAALVAGVVELLAARPIFSRLRPRLWWAIAAAGGLLAAWAVKLAIGVAAGELPIR